MGRDPAIIKWLGVVKDSDGRRFARRRLVARDCNDKPDRRGELFAGTPPFETLKAMLTLAHRDGLNILVIQVKSMPITRELWYLQMNLPLQGPIVHAEYSRD